MKKFKVLMILVLGISLIASGCSKNKASADTWGELEDRGSIIVG